MTSDIQKLVNNIKSFCSTLKVHQVKGKITRCALGLPQDSEGEDESRLEFDLPDNNTNNDSIEKDVIAQKTLRDKSNTESENIAGPNSIQQYNVGNYVLFKIPIRKMEYRYAAIINQIDNKEGEIAVTLMKICDAKGYTFKTNEKDVSDVSFEQIVEKLPNPDLILKGRTRFYLFKLSVPVSEK
ncbi:hypothetical protein HHI36_008172 [Cryptolaemus montrouzieri]|uniref:Uncharacterized protein n=1 Tax=Cryptolaemus montrouzieri TaxID=559131 RepID=A0ABD2MS65_9CUCU